MFESYIGKTGTAYIDHELGLVFKLYDSRNKPVKKNRGSYEASFQREITCLQRLSGKLGFPNLVNIDEDDLVIVMKYCGPSLWTAWPNYDLKSLLPQVKTIINTLKENNIGYHHHRLLRITKKFVIRNKLRENSESELKAWQERHWVKYWFSLKNFCVQDNVLSLIDFDLAMPYNSYNEKYCPPGLKSLYLDKPYNYDILYSVIERSFLNPEVSFKYDVLNIIPKVERIKFAKHFNKKWENNPAGYVDIAKETLMKKVGEKEINAWRSYQKRFDSSDTSTRLKTFRLLDYVNKESKVLDIGCNDGFFGLKLAQHVSEYLGIEPFVNTPKEHPSNCTYIKKDFKDFLQDNTEMYDCLLSLAVTIQIHEFNSKTLKQIACNYCSLLNPNGVLVYESHKQTSRKRNQEHHKQMVDALLANGFKEVMQGVSSRPGRLFAIFKKVS